MKEKKEIGMEKLIDLLNEYEDLSDAEECEKWYIDEYDRISEGGRRSRGTNNWICSKKFGFIKWLVENDKIDKSKVFSFIDTADKPYEDILCLLALSDEPINDLISYLK